MLSHFLLMVLYALLVSAFFALLWRHETRDRVVMFSKIFAWMIAGGLALAWLMYPFPSGPPAPIP
jgi:hypothetical protein